MKIEFFTFLFGIDYYFCNIDLKVDTIFVDVMDLRDQNCKDNSPCCISISASSCREPIIAELCKRSCGYCNGLQPPGFPSYPLPMPVPKPGLHFT